MEKFHFRNGPVSRTGIYSGRSCFKHPRTTREKRQSFEDPKYVRAKRNFKNLADAWDDEFVVFERNWKKFRKTQFKPR